MNEDKVKNQKFFRYNLNFKNSDSFLKGIYIGLGILFIFGTLGIVTAIGFHTAEEIMPGTFSGNYNFDGIVNIEGAQTTFGQTGGGANTIIKLRRPSDGMVGSYIGYSSGINGQLDLISIGGGSTFKFVNHDGGDVLKIARWGELGILNMDPQSHLHIGNNTDAINHYIQIDNSNQAPPAGDCTAETRGRIWYKYDTNTLYLCNGTNWTSTTLS